MQEGIDRGRASKFGRSQYPPKRETNLPPQPDIDRYTALRFGETCHFPYEPPNCCLCGPARQRRRFCEDRRPQQARGLQSGQQEYRRSTYRVGRGHGVWECALLPCANYGMETVTAKGASSRAESKLDHYLAAYSIAPIVSRAIRARAMNSPASCFRLRPSNRSANASATAAAKTAKAAGMDRKMIEAAKGDARPQRESPAGENAVAATQTSPDGWRPS